MYPKWPDHPALQVMQMRLKQRKEKEDADLALAKQSAVQTDENSYVCPKCNSSKTHTSTAFTGSWGCSDAESKAYATCSGCSFRWEV